MSQPDDDLHQVERDNESITRAFNDAWSARDCDRLLMLLADEVRYMVYEGGPEHVGHGAIERAVRPFMAKYGHIEFAIKRLHVLGPVVSHERTEHYYGADGQLDTRFEVVGLLVIKGGKIVIWRDYSLPGVTQLVGPLCTQK
jgi:limonene-1,2-epoxide hydrolase